jgi:predicted DCC family thiol-disulfide oxidoreductase YuxK
MQKKIIVFDGVCNLCNSSITKVINHDKQNQYVFASLQGDAGKKLTKERGIDTDLVDSIILIEPGVAYYTKSTAALKVIKSFGGLYSLFGIFEYLPESIRDAVYDYVAKNRYKWYGKKEACMIPTPELKDKFLD